jgi:hypothetical protein
VEHPVENDQMVIRGRVQNGVVVLDGEPNLPDGTEVTVSLPQVRIWRKPGKKKRVKFPLVDSKQPGQLRLTAEKIAEVLEDEIKTPKVAGTER